jgi:hypothetical protein
MAYVPKSIAGNNLHYPEDFEWRGISSRPQNRWWYNHYPKIIALFFFRRYDEN